MAAILKTQKYKKKRRATKKKKGGDNNLSLVPIKVTTLLRTPTYIGESMVYYDTTQKQLSKLMPLKKFYQYEKKLCQLSALSRLAYSPTMVFLEGVKNINNPPELMNDIITVLESQFKRHLSFQDTFINPLTEKPEYESLIRHAKAIGEFFPKTGCHIVEIDGALYVVFKGSSSMKDFKNDLNVLNTQQLNSIPGLSNLEGEVHKGFYDHMKEELPDIIKSTYTYGKNVKEIYITGHSLGGAMATLFSLIMANNVKELGSKPLHCVTFGAPMMFNNKARNAYNSFLLSGTLTFDRITNSDDPITSLPPSTVTGEEFNHPGFKLLKTEFFPTKKTGRADGIGDIRKIYTGKDEGSGISSSQEFINLFDTTLLKKFPKSRTGSQGFINTLMPAFKGVFTVNAELNKANASAKEQAGNPLNSLPSASVSGGFVGMKMFKKNEEKDKYTAETVGQQPSRVNLGLTGSHMSYCKIKYMNALRLPTLPYKNSSGKIHVSSRKKEPVYRTIITDKYIPVRKERFMEVNK